MEQHLVGALFLGLAHPSIRWDRLAQEAPMTATYEFTAEQNETFKGLIRNMKRSGIMIAIASVILFAYHMVDHFGVSLGATPSAAVYYVDLTLWCLLSAVGL